MRLITITQAAQLLNLTRSGVRDLIVRGRLQADRIGSVWVLSKADVEAYRAERDERRARPRRVAVG